MSLKILFADDSVTAQNMGKKILTEAGYDVVAVSNGAAAVKKIAEQKPDIIILDVYMPGYTGLEVCEKVRGSIETLKTPVLLTVGKLEPYKPEEANRVRADGVIVKPFEASDLLAIVKKFEERLGQAVAAPPLVQRSMDADRLDADEPAEHPEHTMAARIPQATVEVPDHMATASAFSDLLGTDVSHGLGPFNTNQSAAGRDVAPRSDAYSAPIPDYELPVSWRKDVDTIAPSTTPAPTNRATVQEPRPTPPSPTPLRPRQIPVYQDGDPFAVPEVLPTGAAPTGDVIIPREPYLQESDAETTRNTVVDTREPGLVPTIEEASTPVIQGKAPTPLENAASGLHEAGPRLVETPAADTPPGPRLVARPAGSPASEAVETKISESDFEARVVAAMQAYNQASAARDSAGASDEESAPESSAAPQRNQWPPEPSDGARNAEPLPSRAAQVSPAGVKQSVSAPQSSKVAQPSSSSPDVFASESAKNSMSAHVQEAAASAASETGSDHNTIAQAVHRVMERLKPELVEEIVKELKSKK